MDVTVPSGLTGELPVMVTTPGGTSNPVNITILKNTIVTITGTNPFQYSDSAPITARLTDSDGIALAGKQLIFFLDGETASATTDETGQANWTHTTLLPAGTHTLEVNFYSDGTYASSAAYSTITVTTEDVSLSYTGNTRVRYDATITLSAQLVETDASPGSLTNITSVVFEIWDDATQTLIREVTAPVTETSPGQAYATTTTTPLPAGLYTVKVRIGENSYYTATQLVSSGLVVYNPGAGTTAFSGWFQTSGFKDSNYSIGYPSADATVPTGNLFYRDSTIWWASKWAEATSFEYLVLPPTGNTAWIAGSCSYCNSPGYTFTLVVTDNDNLMFGGGNDWYHITIYNPSGVVVYEMNERVTWGTIAIYRS